MHNIRCEIGEAPYNYVYCKGEEGLVDICEGTVRLLPLCSTMEHKFEFGAHTKAATLFECEILFGEILNPLVGMKMHDT